MSISLICVACLGILNIGMGFAVSHTRSKTGVMIGVPSEASHALSRVVRAHSNTAEYGAILALMIYILGTQQPATWVTAMMVGATLARISIVVGLLTGDLDRPTFFRFAGSLGTYIFGLALSAALLIQAVGG